MKAIAERQSLLTACQLANAAVPTRDIKPILKNFKAVTHATGCTLMATDLEVGIRVEVRGFTAEEPGECILPAARLLAILKEAGDRELALDANPSSCLVRGAALEFELLSEDPSQFPDVPAFSEESYHEITAGTLREMIRKTAFAAAEDQGRYSMMGVMWELKDATCRLVATDGKRLAITEGVATSKGEHETSGMPVVPVKTMALLEKSLADDADGTVRICFYPNDVLFWTEKAVIYSRLIEGRFPDWKVVLPKKKFTPLTLAVGPLHTALRQASITAEADSRRLDWHFTKGLITFKAHGATAGRSKVELPIEYAGPTLTLGFNPDYVMEFLKVLLPDAQVTADLVDSKTPVLFHAGEHYRYLVMPLT